MLTQNEKGRAFRVLHQRDRAFIIPNPWDVGSARILAQLGFEALATTSMGYAFSKGRRDGKITRDETLAQRARDRGYYGASGERRSGELFWRRA